jgi:hypothetical protein
MTVSFTEVRYPIAPTLTKRRGTLLDTVPVTPGIAFLEGTDLFESYNCLTFDAVTGAWCAPGAKDLSDAAGWVNGFRTAVYGGVTCKSVGGDMAARKAEVERVFSMGESTGVERALMANRFKVGATTGSQRALVGNGNVTFTDTGDLVTTPAAHGLVADTPVTFNTISGTTGITSGATYYVRNPAATTFQVATAPGGTPLALTTNGTGTGLVATTPVTTWPAPVDITPAGGAVKPTVGLALLEGYGANNYAGAPTVHLPVSVASLALGVNGAVWSGDTLHSQLGTPIVAGAGYDYPNLGPTGAGAPAGEKWAYVTGSVVINAGDLIVQDALDRDKNDHVTLAERGYVIAVDCFAAAVRVGMNT